VAPGTPFTASSLTIAAGSARPALTVAAACRRAAARTASRLTWASQAAHPRVLERFDPRPGGSNRQGRKRLGAGQGNRADEPAEKLHGLRRQRHVLADASQSLERLGHGQPVGHIGALRGQIEQRLLGRAHVGGLAVRQPPDAFGQRRPRVGILLVREARDESLQHHSRSGSTVRAALHARRRLGHRIGGFSPYLRVAIDQCRQDVGDERRPFEPTQGADGEPGRLRIGAADPGADGGEIGRRGCSPILCLKNGKPRRINGLTEGRRTESDEQKRKPAPSLHAPRPA
jgi:hypothetical protein